MPTFKSVVKKASSLFRRRRNHAADETPPPPSRRSYRRGDAEKKATKTRVKTFLSDISKSIKRNKPSRLASEPPVTSDRHPAHHPFPSSSPQKRIFSPPGSPNTRSNPRSVPSPSLPDQPGQQSSPKCRSKDCDSERPSHRKTPPRAPSLRMSKSASTLNHDSPGSTLVPRGRSNHASSTASHATDALRSSAHSIVTSHSSTEQASSTERSSVLTKASSFTSDSIDTADRPCNDHDEGGVSVEDAIAISPNRESESSKAEHQSVSFDKRKQSETEEDGDDDDHDDGDEHKEQSSNMKPTDPSPSSEQLESSIDLRLLPTPPETDSSKGEPSHSHPKQQQQDSKIVIPGVIPSPLQQETGYRDRYGFQKANHHVTIEQYEAWNNTHSNFNAQQKAKWIELLKENNLPTVNPVIFPPKSSRMKRFVRKGIPSEFRGAAWFWYAGGYGIMKQNPGRFEKCVRTAMKSPNNDDKEQIERDLHRTFPDNLHFKPEKTSQPGRDMDDESITVETEMIQSLRRVLYAFALHNPKVGYTQSLNFIAGLLLLILPEENAFWMLHIVTSECLPGTHEIGLEGANVDLWIIMVLLRKSFPRIYSKIASPTPSAARSKPPPLTVNSELPDVALGLTNWLMSLFIGALPMETTLRVWDVLFYEGSCTFFRVSLAIFEACESDVLHASDLMEVFQVMQAVPQRLLDADLLLRESFARKLRITQKRIEDLRATRRAGIRGRAV